MASLPIAAARKNLSNFSPQQKIPSMTMGMLSRKFFPQASLSTPPRMLINPILLQQLLFRSNQNPRPRATSRSHLTSLAPRSRIFVGASSRASYLGMRMVIAASIGIVPTHHFEGDRAGLSKRFSQRQRT